MRRSVLEVGTPVGKLSPQLGDEAQERGACGIDTPAALLNSLLEKFQKSESLVSRIFPKSLLLSFSFLLFLPLDLGMILDSRSRKLSTKQIIRKRKLLLIHVWRPAPTMPWQEGRSLFTTRWGWRAVAASSDSARATNEAVWPV